MGRLTTSGPSGSLLPVAEEVEKIEAQEDPREILNFVTGELIPVGDLPRLAQAIETLRQHDLAVRSLRAALTDAVIAESRRQGTRTLVAGGLVVTLSPDYETEWDVEELEKLRDAGLPEERYQQLVKTEITYKVDGRVARQLESASEEYAAIIARARRREPKRQYASVKPAV